MTDQTMKKLLKSAYQLSPSKRENAFLRQYERRSLRIFDVLILELKYMRIQSILSLTIMLMLFFFMSISRNPKLIWYVSGILPVVGLLLMSGMGKSERHGMQELEMASRFSLRFIKATRLFLLGIASFGIMLSVSLLLQRASNLGFWMTLGVIGIPYMLNAWGNLVITRRWHDKDSILGCVAVTCVTCMLPILMKQMIGLSVIEPLVIMLIMAILIALTVRESIVFMKGREDLSWNFC